MAAKPLLPLCCPSLKQKTPLIFSHSIHSYPFSGPAQNHHNHHREPQQRRQTAVSVSFNPSGNYDLSLFEEENEPTKVAPPMPPTEGRYEIVIDNDVIRRLDLTPFHKVTGIVSPFSAEPQDFIERTIGFSIDYQREDGYDTRELSEYPDIRLWFVRLDSTYPWLPVLLDWRAGELARYAAMLTTAREVNEKNKEFVMTLTQCGLPPNNIVHCGSFVLAMGSIISIRMGVVFNPEALELFVMKKVFIVYAWLKHHKVPKPRLKTSDMARMLGYGIGNELYDLIDQQSSTD